MFVLYNPAKLHRATQPQHPATQGALSSAPLDALNAAMSSDHPNFKQVGFFVSFRFGSVRFVLVWFGSFRFVSVRFGSVRFRSVRFGSVSSVQGPAL
jgi:hypothetical protein